jgi:hypothetical protein
MLFLAEGVDSRPVTGAEDNIPEPVRVVEVVAAGDGHCGCVLHAAAREQIREGGLRGDPVPGVESFEQRRLDVAHGFPESGVGGLEEVRAPGGDRQYAPGRTSRHISATNPAISGAKNTPNMQITASKLPSGSAVRVASP